MITLDRRHALAGRDNLDWFFANRKWIRTRIAVPEVSRGASKLAIVECAWALRALPESESGVRFLLLAPKRSHKRAHDRNKIKRWLRAAIHEIEAFAQLEEMMLVRGEQLLVMMRISKPVREVKWPVLLEDTQHIGEHLKKRV